MIDHFNSYISKGVLTFRVRSFTFFFPFCSLSFAVWSHGRTMRRLRAPVAEPQKEDAEVVCADVIPACAAQKVREQRVMMWVSVVNSEIPLLSRLAYCS